MDLLKSWIQSEEGEAMEWSEDHVRIAVMDLLKGMSQKALAKISPLSQPVISYICNGTMKYRTGQDKIRQFSDWYKNYKRHPDFSTPDIDGHVPQDSRLRFHPTAELTFMRKWYKRHPNPTSEELLFYLNELNRAPIRQERPKITLNHLRSWWKNERQRLRKSYKDMGHEVGRREHLPFPEHDLNNIRNSFLPSHMTSDSGIEPGSGPQLSGPPLSGPSLSGPSLSGPSLPIPLATGPDDSTSRHNSFTLPVDFTLNTSPPKMMSTITPRNLSLSRNKNRTRASDVESNSSSNLLSGTSSLHGSQGSLHPGNISDTSNMSIPANMSMPSNVGEVSPSNQSNVQKLIAHRPTMGSLSPNHQSAVHSLGINYPHPGSISPINVSHPAVAQLSPIVHKFEQHLPEDHFNNFGSPVRNIASNERNMFLMDRYISQPVFNRPHMVPEILFGVGGSTIARPRNDSQSEGGDGAGPYT